MLYHLVVQFGEYFNFFSRYGDVKANSDLWDENVRECLNSIDIGAQSQSKLLNREMELQLSDLQRTILQYSSLLASIFPHCYSIYLGLTCCVSALHIWDTSSLHGHYYFNQNWLSDVILSPIFQVAFWQMYAPSALLTSASLLPL